MPGGLGDSPAQLDRTPMLELLFSSMSLMWSPSSGWRRVRAARTDAMALVLVVIVLGLLPLIGRFIGHHLAGHPSSVATADAILFVFFQVGSASGAGVLIAAAARRMGSDLSELQAQRLLLLSATPVMLLGMLYSIPLPTTLWPYVQLLSLGWGALLLFRGLWAVAGLELRALTMLALTGASAWILSSVILSQVLLLLLMPR